MRTFRLLGMALLAIVMCANFTACSSDDDEVIKDDDGVITNQKKLVEIKSTSDDGETTLWEYSYDTKGRLVSVTRTEKYDSNTDRDIIDFTWGNNTVIATKLNNSRTYTLTDHLVRTQQDNDGYNKSFTYDSSSQLAKVKETNSQNNGTDTYIYTWENKRMTKFTNTYINDSKEETAVYEYTYSGKTCKGWFPNIEDEAWEPIDDDCIFYAHPELVGMRTTQLPDQIYNKDDAYEMTIKYTYKMDKDGYVENCTVINIEKSLSDNKTETDTTIYTLKWE